MTHDEAFLEAIREAPDDDTPRLLCADWLEEGGDPRGEFIRVQCARAKLPPDDPLTQPLMRRAWELFSANHDAWVGPIRELVGPDFYRRGESWLGRGRLEAIPEKVGKYPRGFVEELTLDADRFFAAADQSSRLVVLRSVQLWGAGARPHLLKESSRLTYLESLSCTDHYMDPFNDKCARALAASPHVARLTALRLRANHVGDAGAEALAGAPWLARLRLLDLARNGLSLAGVEALAASPNLSHSCAVYLGNEHLDRDALARLADAHGRPLNQFMF